jgi:hypothetical protein
LFKVKEKWRKRNFEQSFKYSKADGPGCNQNSCTTTTTTTTTTKGSTFGYYYYCLLRW